MQAAIRRGAFRKELYFRLDVVSIKIPPLRERKSDIPLLVHYFIERHGRNESNISGITSDALNKLMSYDWPGNVRELENCVQRALALGSGVNIQVRDLPTNLLHHGSGQGEDQGIEPLKAVERRAVLQALETTRGDRLRAARLLGIGKTTIYRKIKEYGLDTAPGMLPSS